MIGNVPKNGAAWTLGLILLKFDLVFLSFPEQPAKNLNLLLTNLSANVKLLWNKQAIKSGQVF